MVVEKTPESPLDCRRSKQSILREINLEYSLEGPMLKLQYFDHLTLTDDSLEKSLMLGKIKSRRRRRHHQCNEHKVGQTLGDGEGQGSLACCSPWGCKESYMTGQLNINSNMIGGGLRRCSKESSSF